MDVIFEPIYCYAGNENENINDIFNNIQMRMRIILGFLLSKKSQEDQYKIVCEKNNLPESLLKDLNHWQKSNVIFTTEEFSSLSSDLGGPDIVDILGMPNLCAFDKEKILKKFKKIENYSFDPALAFITLATLDKIDILAKEKRKL